MISSIAVPAPPVEFVTPRHVENRGSEKMLMTSSSSTVPDSSPLLPRLHIQSDTEISLVAYIENKFIPDHVLLKSAAGRAHYHAILKHVLRPETVDCLFKPYIQSIRTRLQTTPGWPYLDGLLLTELTSEHVSRLVASAMVRGYSPQTVKHIRNVVSAILSHAQREGLIIGRNPASAVELPPMARRKLHHLTLAQAKAVLNSTQNPQRIAALLTIVTGLSIADICALRWKHLDFTASQLWVERRSARRRNLASRKSTAERPSASDPRKTECFPLSRTLLRTLQELKHSCPDADSECCVVGKGSRTPLRPLDLPLKSVARQLHMPWLSWQVVRRAHSDLRSQLMLQIADDLLAAE